MEHAAILLIAALAPRLANAECFPEIERARQVFIVVPVSSSGPPARLAIWERDARSGQWTRMGTQKPAIVGRTGIAWARPFAHFAARGEALKMEGDGKTPAGIFAVAAPFGTGPNSLSHYVKLEGSKQFCVDDPSSEYYNTVVPKSRLSKPVSGEDMPTISLYRRGLFIDYPSDRRMRGGSCIFIHVWTSSKGKTAGCVALAEQDVADLQGRAAQGQTLLAVLPAKEADALTGCMTAP